MVFVFVAWRGVLQFHVNSTSNSSVHRVHFADDVFLSSRRFFGSGFVEPRDHDSQQSFSGGCVSLSFPFLCVCACVCACLSLCLSVSLSRFVCFCLPQFVCLCLFCVRLARAPVRLARECVRLRTHAVQCVNVSGASICFQLDFGFLFSACRQSLTMEVDLEGCQGLYQLW